MCFIVYIKTNDIYKYIAEDVETKFDFQIMNQIAHWLKEKIKKSNQINERRKFCGKS